MKCYLIFFFSWQLHGSGSGSGSSAECLEKVNSELKAQIEELRLERQQLMVMLNLHRPTFIVRMDSVKTPKSEANSLLEQLATEAK
uniref:Uncharacterized protein n=1 Tax=Myripristis murdjan TaxID=586833 RepID=A0A667X570_9TELE